MFDERLLGTGALREKRSKSGSKIGGWYFSISSGCSTWIIGVGQMITV